MQPNYEAEARRRQEEQERQRFQQQRDPFKYGQEVARRRYSEIMSGLDARKKDASRSYSDMYQAAKQMSVRDAAAGGPTLTGGMKRQASDLLSASQVQALGQIGAQREKALREIDLQKQSAFSNAQLEGQQAEQMALQGAQTRLQLVQQKNQILSDKNLDTEQKQEQLRALGYTKEADSLNADTSGDSGDGKLFQAILGLGGGATIIGGSVSAAKAATAAKAAAAAGGATATAVKSAGFLAGAGKVLGVAFVKVLPVIAIAYGVEKLTEYLGVRDGKGLVDFV